jgi:hypothetical protein
MSVLAKVREIYLEHMNREAQFDVTVLATLRRGGKSHGSGNPSGSAVGKCTAQLQMLRYPDISKPESYPLRSKMVMEGGDLLEAWWAAAIELGFPNLSGRKNELFYFPVPLEKSDVTKLLAKVPEAFKKRKPGQFWGELDLRFVPPSISMTDKGPMLRNKIERDPRSIKAREAKIATLPKGLHESALAYAKDARIPIVSIEAALGIPALTARPLGFVLNPVDGVIWAPTYVDRILVHPDHGPTVLEKKAVSNYAFRRAVLGEVDFEKRCQMVTFVEATKLPVAWLMYRKETAHLLEIFFAPDNNKVQVTFTKSNGVQEIFIRKNGKLVRQGPVPEGQLAEIADQDYPESEWDVAETWTPYDGKLLEQIHDNVRRVLLAEPGDWYRRYGPSFVCKTCQGSGLQTLSKSTKEPLKKAKPCEDCDQSGVVERAQLPVFPCGYCPVNKQCWEKAGLEIEITEKPKFWVTRAAFQASGIIVTPFGAASEGVDPGEPLI